MPKNNGLLAAVAALVFAVSAGVASDRSLTTVSPDSATWGANVGWFNWYADGEVGAGFTPKIASGLVWSANVGWINLGSGVPLDGEQYSNIDGVDFGVNVDSESDPNYFFLSGNAWSANLGWISFDLGEGKPWEDRPRIEKNTGILRGKMWIANAGPVSLEGEKALVRTGLKRPASDIADVLLGRVEPHAGLDVDGNGVIENADVANLLFILP